MLPSVCAVCVWLSCPPPLPWPPGVVLFAHAMQLGSSYTGRDSGDFSLRLCVATWKVFDTQTVLFFSPTRPRRALSRLVPYAPVVMPVASVRERETAELGEKDGGREPPSCSDPESQSTVPGLFRKHFLCSPVEPEHIPKSPPVSHWPEPMPAASAWTISPLDGQDPCSPRPGPCLLQTGSCPGPGSVGLLCTPWRLTRPPSPVSEL